MNVDTFVYPVAKRGESIIYCDVPVEEFDAGKGYVAINGEIVLWQSLLLRGYVEPLSDESERANPHHDPKTGRFTTGGGGGGGGVGSLDLDEMIAKLADEITKGRITSEDVIEGAVKIDAATGKPMLVIPEGTKGDIQYGRDPHKDGRVEFDDNGWIKSYPVVGGSGVTSTSQRDTEMAILQAHADYELEMPKDEFRKVIIDDARERMAAIEPTIYVKPIRALGVLREGRFKSQFETYTSSGALNPDLRADYEARHVVGFRGDVVPASRPIYGSDTFVNLKDHPMEATDVRGMYGRVEIKLKKDVVDRTTVTLGDSLNTRRSSIPLREVKTASPDRILAAMEPNYANVVAKRNSDSEGPAGWRKSNEYFSYPEVQIHGGVTLDDIDQVFLHPGLDGMGDEIADVLTQKNIPFTKLYEGRDNASEY